MPRMKTLDKYSDFKGQLSSTEHIGYLLRTSPDWDYLKRLRDAKDKAEFDQFMDERSEMPETAPETGENDENDHAAKAH